DGLPQLTVLQERWAVAEGVEAEAGLRRLRAVAAQAVLLEEGDAVLAEVRGNAGGSGSGCVWQGRHGEVARRPEEGGGDGEGGELPLAHGATRRRGGGDCGVVNGRNERGLILFWRPRAPGAREITARPKRLAEERPLRLWPTLPVRLPTALLEPAQPPV